MHLRTDERTTEIKLRYQALSKILEGYWYSFNDEPVCYSGKVIFPRLSSPSFLLPEESPDGLWHLFADSALGLEHYSSTSGLEWEKAHLVFSDSRFSFIYKEGSTYYLLYETHKKNKEFKKDSSRIMITSSTDLSLWSEPKMILDGSTIKRASYKGGKERLFYPNLIQWDGKYRLYFGAGDVILYDSKEHAAASFMMAEAEYIDGPYKVDAIPIWETDGGSKFRNLAAGAVRIVPCADGLAAISVPYYYSEEENRSKSLMLLSSSLDGIAFKDEKVIEKTPDEGWASGYITGADMHYKESDDAWYCYFSAMKRNTFHGIPYTKESIGLIIGKDR